MELPVLNNIFSLVICFIPSDVYMSIPISQFIPPPPPPSLALSFPLYPSPSSHSDSFSGSYLHYSLSVSSTPMQAGFSTKPKTIGSLQDPGLQAHTETLPPHPTLCKILGKISDWLLGVMCPSGLSMQAFW